VSDAELNNYDDAAVERIVDFVEQLTGGKIVDLERLVRWRPSWFADVEVDGEVRRLHLRGDRGGDVSIFPDLKREADVIEILHRHGLPVPEIHGYLADPPCIVMEAIDGTRDFSKLSEELRSTIGRDYMRAVAAMHSVPLEPFVAAGVEAPEGSEDIALVGLDAYMPHYRRTKSRPEPLLEFVIRWLRRNVPRHRSKGSFIQFDSGQYLVHEDRMTKLYDFEFSMIGDPLVDIATMGMRNSYESLGAPLPELVRYYEEATGEPVDHEAVIFHVLQFSLLGTMQFTGTVGRPTPGDPHSVYLMFDLSLRRSILLALSRLSGVALPELPPLPDPAQDNAPLLAKLADFEDVVALDRAVEIAAGHGDLMRALAFLMDWPAHREAAALVLKRRAELRGAHNDLPAWAERLSARHPQAALLLVRSRALALRRLGAGFSDEVADLIIEAESLAVGLTDDAIPSHAAFLAELR